MRSAYHSPDSRAPRSGFALRGLCMLAVFLGCSAATADSTAPTTSVPAAVVITPISPAIPLGSQMALQAQVHDAGGNVVNGLTVFWSSSDTSIASVSSTGVVTGKSVGSAQIAASAGGQSAVVAVTIVPVSVASVSVIPAVSTLVIGGAVTLQAVAYDANGGALSGRSIVWASSDSRIATVDASGKVVGAAAGTATITGTGGGKTGSATVTVTLLPVASVVISPGSATVAAGQTASFSAVATDSNGNTLSGRPITWSSANTAVASISSLGLVTAIAAGNTTITATSGGVSANAQVTVTLPASARVATIRVSPATLSLQPSHSATLTAQLFDSNGNQLSGRSITWSSSNSHAISVASSGSSTATVQAAPNAEGTATITATAEGVSGSATVTVRD